MSSLLSRHVSQLKSEEVVLGCSIGWVGKEEQEGKESTKLCIVAMPSQTMYTGFTGIDQKIADASVGKSMQGKQFPARCVVSYQRQVGSQKSSFNGRETVRDVELLVVVGIEYICPVDLVDVKVKAAA